MGYTGVMGTGLGLYILASTYGVLRLWGFKGRVTHRTILSPLHIFLIYRIHKVFDKLLLYCEHPRYH